MMLVLRRKVQEEIVINGNIRVQVLRVSGGKVRLGITAPAHISVNRGEVERELPTTPANGGTPGTV